MAGPSLSERTSPVSSAAASIGYPSRSRRQKSPPPPQQGDDDSGMFKSDHMVSIRNPFPRAKKTANIDTSSPPNGASAPKPTGGKLLSRPSNRIVSHSISESSNSSSSSASRSAASSALASLTRFHPLSMGSNQSSSSTSTATSCSNDTLTYYSDSYSRSVSSKDRDDDFVDGGVGTRIAVGGGASNNNSSGSSLPALSASNTQGGSSNISVGASSSSLSSSLSSLSSSSTSYHQRLQISGVTRENSSSIILPGPSGGEIVNKTNPKGLVGLQNLGNTCFMNSCLQCVSNIPAVVRYFQSGLYTKEINESSPTKGALASVFGDLIKSLWSNDKFSATRPVELKRVIGKVASRFTGYDQQDAQEFLRFLLDGLHEDFNKIKKKPPYYEIKDRENTKDRDVSDEHWKFYFERNLSHLSELFCGQLRSEIRCSTCNHRSLCFDVFWDLSLPVPKKPKSSHHMRISSVFGSSSSSSPKHSGHSDDEHSASNGGGCSVQDCLKVYTDQEFLNENDAYYCGKCKTHRAVSKKISLYRLPQVLVIHLKRFSYSTFSRDKVSTAIKFPAQGLDIADYCAADAVVDGSTAYDLTGVVHHVGSLNGGHYTAECLNKDTQEWFDFNDESVSAVKKPQLCSSSAYILFFRRREEKSLTI